MTVARRSKTFLWGLAWVGGLISVAVGSAVLAVILEVVSARGPCGSATSGAVAATLSGPVQAIALGPAGGGVVAGATEYGGPGDPSSGVVGASGANLLEHPDSYAELGGLSFQTATMMGGLPYMTPLRITWGERSAVAYKRDFGFGGGPIDGRPRVIDLWWELAGRLGVPYENGQWSGLVQLQRPPGTGAGEVLGQDRTSPAVPASASSAGAGADCAAVQLAGVPVTAGPRAVLLPGGLATAPAGAPLAVKEIIAAGNQIVGKPYVYGGGHGVPLSEVAPAYDCSGSVEHLLYGARLLPVTYEAASSELESFGAPGPGRWVTLYANADHVFMYVAGLRWDTSNMAGPEDGPAGIGWHPSIRDAAGFVARHPVGL